MVCVDNDIAKDKHDCYIITSEGKIIANVFTIPNDLTGLDLLYSKIQEAGWM